MILPTFKFGIFAFGFLFAVCFYLGEVAVQAKSEQESTLQVNEQDFKRFSELMRFLREHRREDLFVPVSKLQLNHITKEANQIEAINPDRAKELRRFARGICFNIASFTWPGWGDSPEPIPVEQQQLGLAAAIRGVQIADSIDDLTVNILWIRGAHELNAGDYDASIKSFQSAKDLAQNALDKLVQSTWAQLSQSAMNEDEKSQVQLNAMLDQLRSSKHEHAGLHVEQIETAANIYLVQVDAN